MTGRRAVLGVALLLGLGACRGAPISGSGAAIDAEARRRAPAVGGRDSLGRDRVRGLLADGLSLEDALRIALVGNAALLAEYEDLDIAYADLAQAGLPGNPSFDGAYRFVTDGPGEVIEAALVQPLQDLLLMPRRRCVAEAEVCAVRARLVAAALSTLGDVRRAWYDVVAAEQRVELRRTATLAARAGYEAAEELRRSGNITALDVGREQTFYEERRALLADAQLEAYAAREMLNQHMGIGGELTAWEIEHRLPEMSTDDPATPEVERRAVASSQDLAERRAEMTALGRRLGLTCLASVVRDVSVGVGSERESDGQWSVGPVIALEIPLFDHGQAAVPRARAELRQAMLRLVARAVEVRTQARIEAETLGSAARQARHARDVLLPLRQGVLDEVMKQSNAMQVGVFHVLEAKREVITAGEELVEATHRYWTARSRVDQILAGALPPMHGEGG